MFFLKKAVVCSLVVLIISLSSAGAAHAQDGADAELRPVFINLTAGEDDLQAASMALMLASNSLKSGREVTVFVNVHATQLIKLERGDLALYRRDITFHAKFAELIEAGAVILACPYCMARNDLEAEDIIAGVVPADGENFFTSIDDGAAVFSY